MTLAEWEALPEDNTAHYELQEGVLLVAPKRGPQHQLALFHLAALLREQRPKQWDVIPSVEVVVQAGTPATVRAPDVVVTRAGHSVARFHAADVVLAVEVISPGSRNVDLHLKPFEYAEAGIPHYWVVDLDPPVPSITVIEAGRRRVVTGELVVEEPFPLRIDLGALG
ncbi:hypothetical protein BJF78_24955 [Pseudonocardia sp. CNS-139]|nr:hypothetical protein BJF78_24955 [Pseudonocardia sp. CNS-139]